MTEQIIKAPPEQKFAQQLATLSQQDSGNKPEGFVLSSDVSSVLDATELDFSSCYLEGASLILSYF